MNALITDRIRADREAGNWGEMVVPRALVSRVVDTLLEFLDPDDPADAEDMADHDALYFLLLGLDKEAA